MYNKKNCSHRSANNSRNHYNSNTVINLVNIIYDDEFVSLINNLSSSLKDYFKLLNTLLNNIREITSTLSNQTLYSKCLLNECLSIDKNIYTDKLMQLSDRIDIIDNNKKLLDNNISLIDANMSSFLDKAKILFKKMKITRNSKINKTIKKERLLQKNMNNRNIFDFYKNYKNINYNSNDNSKIILKNKNYSSTNNKRCKNPIISQYDNPNYCFSTIKNNKTSKSYSKNLVNNNLFINDDYSYNYNNNVKNDAHHFSDINHIRGRQKTFSFNLRQFLFKNNRNKIENLLEKSNESNPLKNSLTKMKNSNNSLINYYSLIDISKTKNNRNINTKESNKNKNISSFNNDISLPVNNFKMNNKMELDNNKNIYNFKNCWNKTNLELKNYSHKNIDYNNNMLNSLNCNNKDTTINCDMNKSQNSVPLNLANSVIEYFMFLKNINNTDEKNTNKIKKIEKKLVDLSLNIINNYKSESTSNLNLTDSIKQKENKNRINELKNNYMKFTNRNKRMQNNNYFNMERRNINLSKNKNQNQNNASNLNNSIKKEKIFRNSDELKIYNSVGNLNQYAKNRNTLNNKNSNYNVIYKLRDKDIFSNKYKLKFLPFNSCIRSYSDRKEIKWYIKIINKRLNIINVLNVLEQCDKLRKEVDNSILNSHNSVLTPIHSAYMSFMHNNYINHNEYKKSDGKKNGIV